MRPSREVTTQIVLIVFFTFVVYLTIGIPLAVVPSFVQSLGFGPVLAGLAISVQYIATFASRPSSGRMSDTKGPKGTVLFGLAICGVSGLFMMLTSALTPWPWLSLTSLFVGRLFLGWGEGCAATGAILWGVGRVGAQHTAKVISLNGVATYTALAVGAPLGIFLEQKFGFFSIGLSVVLLAWLSFPLAWIKKPSLPIVGKPIPIHRVFGRILPYGMGLALGSFGFGTIATFITLYYAKFRWADPAWSLTAFGLFFVGVRLLFASFIDRLGGYRVAIVSFVVEFAGLLVLGTATSMPQAFLGCVLTGMGFSLIFPSLGVEAMMRVTPDNRGAALAMYSVFVDVSLGVTGPLGGWLANRFGFGAIYLVASGASICALLLLVPLFLRQRSFTFQQTPS